MAAEHGTSYYQVSYNLLFKERQCVQTIENRRRIFFNDEFIQRLRSAFKVKVVRFKTILPTNLPGMYGIYPVEKLTFS